MSENEKTKIDNHEYELIKSQLNNISNSVPLLEGFFLYSPVALQIYNSEGRSVLVNPAFMKMFKVAPPPEYCVFNDDLAQKLGVLDSIKKAFSGEAVFIPAAWYDPNQLEQVKIEGAKPCALESIFFPILSSDKKISYVVNVIRDVTETVIATEHLKSSEARFKAIIENNSDMITLIDRDKHNIYISPSVLSILGYSPEELFGHRSSELVHKDDLEEFLKIKKNAIDNPGKTYHLTHRMIRKDNGIAWVDGSITNLSHVAGISENVINFRDITEERKVEAQLLRTQRMESIGTLAGGIAHDLNNILAPILLSMDFLQKNSTEEKILNRLQMIEVNVKRAASLVRQVLSFSNGMEGNKVFTNPQQVLNDLILMIKESFPKNISIVFEIDPELKSLFVDPSQLHQVLLNLIINAKDAMPEGGDLKFTAQNMTIDAQYASLIDGAKPGDYVMFKVSDTGYGISSAILSRIFEPFFTTKEKFKGTGLGLSTSLAIVKGHGGFINVYSEVNQGTTFKVYLPIEKPKEHEPIDLNPTPLDTLPRGSGQTVLIVDDESAIRSVCQNTLESFGYKTLTAMDGAEAIAIYAQKQAEIAVVLTDMMMPIMDGPATIRSLKRINPDVRIIAASGLGSNGKVAKAANAGVVHFLPKPYSVQSLLQIIYNALNS
jgi:PAS domain S-box-containing protein